MAGQKKTREKIMEEALKDGGVSIPDPIPQRSMPKIDLNGACVTSELDIEDVCNTLVDGWSLRDIAEEMDHNHMRKHGKPRERAGKRARMHATTILRWIESASERVKMYEDAREMQADAYFSEILQLSNEKIPLTIFGSFDSAAVQDKKLRLEALKYIASKLAPKRYGEKLDLTSGGDKIPPMSPQQADARLIALIDKAKPHIVALPRPEAGDES